MAAILTHGPDDASDAHSRSGANTYTRSLTAEPLQCSGRLTELSL